MSNIKKSIEESIKRGLDVVNTPEVILSNLEYLLIQVAESLNTDNNTVLYNGRLHFIQEGRKDS